MILEATIGVCIHEWSKIQYVNKGVVKRSLIGSSTWVISPLADLSGFHSIYEFSRRQRKYRLSNVHEIRKYFGNQQTINSWAVLRFCFVRTAPFLNITTLRKSGPRCNRMHPLYGALPVHMCQWGLHMVSWTHIGILMRLLNTEPGSTAELI